MSDTSQGPGWWQASDGKWYPPEQAPGYDAGAGGAPAAGGPGVPAGSAGGTASIGEAISYGWNKFQANVGQLLVAALIGFGIMLVLTLVGYFIVLIPLTRVDPVSCGVNANGVFACTGGGGPGLITVLLAQAILFVLVWFGQFIFDMLMIRAGLLTTAGQPLETSSILSADKIGPYLVASIIVAIAAGVGFFLCIIPGIAVLIFCRFFGFYILDKGMSPIDGIKASFDLVKDNFGTIFLFLLAVYAINVVGAILCYIGLLVTVPLTAIATAYMYRKVEGQPIAA